MILYNGDPVRGSDVNTLAVRKGVPVFESIVIVIELPVETTPNLKYLFFAVHQ